MFQVVANDVKKEEDDQGRQISFITHVPPKPLDTYVNVDGHQASNKKKNVKPNNSSSNISEDILRGVVFPRPKSETDSPLDESMDASSANSGERLAKGRLRYVVRPLGHREYYYDIESISSSRAPKMNRTGNLPTLSTVR